VKLSGLTHGAFGMRRFPFSLVIIFPLGYSTRFNNAAGCPHFIQPRQKRLP
jgi:hypothetical protein